MNQLPLGSLSIFLSTNWTKKCSCVNLYKLLFVEFVLGTSFAAKFLRTNGITLFKVREEVVKMLGKSDMYYFSPEHPPLTEPAQKALDWAVDQKMNSGVNDMFCLYARSLS